MTQVAKLVPPSSKKDNVNLLRRPVVWDEFFTLLKGAKIPKGFLGKKERTQGTEKRDPLS